MTRTVLHRLVDELPDTEIPAAARFLEFLRDVADPLLRSLRDAPEGEPLDEDEAAAIAEAEEAALCGEVLPHEQLRRQLES